ncbi:MAG: N-acetylmuramoyl-L-alanine amidase [Bacteroidales bacterium]|nr:N-acetylmuramoyl-L-alanine amidase [Bacteroidales bacterium]
MRWYKHIVFVSLLIVYSFNNELVAQVNTVALKTIVIDAGHGGKDPGAVGNNLKEKDITLSIALKLGELIKKHFPDVKVVYTRSTDEFIELFKRAKIANNAKADLFISIHVNSNKKPDPSGAETYVMGLSKSNGNLDVAMTENAVILKEDDYKNQYEGFDPHSPEAYIIFSLYQNANLDLGLTFSSLIQEEYRKINREDRGVKQAGFLVLWKTAMPSVLTEVGFISNPEDAKYLAKEKNHWLIAKSLFNSFSKYKGQLEGKKYTLLTTDDLPKVIEKEDTIIEHIKIIPKDTIQKQNYTPTVNKPKHEVKDSVINEVNNDFQKIAEKLVNNAVRDTILFWVQLASSDKKIPIQKFAIEPVTEMKWDNLYKYLYGPLKTYAEIIDKQKEVKKQYPDAFIVATKNGKKIQLSDAIKQTKN